MKKISRNSFIKRLTIFTLGLINLPLIKFINPLIKNLEVVLLQLQHLEIIIPLRSFSLENGEIRY